MSHDKEETKLSTYDVINEESTVNKKVHHRRLFIGVDLGGSLVKMCWSEEGKGSEAHCRLFKSTETSLLIESVKNLHRDYLCTLVLTGGGAKKRFDALRESYPNNIFQVDEIQSAAMGLSKNLEPANLPCLLVNIGTGTSIIHVPLEVKSPAIRISGTAIGGGTFVGLAGHIAANYDFGYLVGLADQGKQDLVNISVGDIYGSDYVEAGLPSHIVASYFGSLGRETTVDSIDKKDIVSGLLHMIIQNTCQLAILHAQALNLKSIYFSGGFVAKEGIIQSLLIEGIKSLSKGTMASYCVSSPLFLASMGAMHFGKTVSKDGSVIDASKCSHLTNWET